MMTIQLVLGTLLFATFVGWLINRAMRLIRSHRKGALVSLAASIAGFAITFLLFHLVALFVPPNNASSFSTRTSVYVYLDCTVCDTDNRYSYLPIQRILLEMPAEIGPDGGWISLTLVQHFRAAPENRASLAISSGVLTKASNPCGPSQTTNHDVRRPICTEPQDISNLLWPNEHSAYFEWAVHPTDTGMPWATFTLPAAAVHALNLTAHQWTFRVERGGTKLSTGQADKVLNAAGLIIDLKKGIITAKLTVPRTLGVSREAYRQISVWVAFAAGLLASGYLWRLLLIGACGIGLVKTLHASEQASRANVLRGGRIVWGTLRLTCVILTTHAFVLLGVAIVIAALGTPQLRDIGAAANAEPRSFSPLIRLLLPQGMFSLNLIVASCYASFISTTEMNNVCRDLGMKRRWLARLCYIIVPLGICAAAQAATALTNPDDHHVLFLGTCVSLVILVATWIAYRWVGGRSHVGRKFIVIVLFAMLSISAVVCTVLALRTQTSSLVGPVGMVLLSVSFWAAILNTAWLFMTRVLRIPAIMIPLSIALAFLLFESDDPYTVPVDHHERVERLRTLARFKAPRPTTFESWLVDRYPQDPMRPIPVYLVAVEGGGIRAGYWGARMLALINEATAGDFAKHVFAYSGVSGGSLGVATFLDITRVAPNDFQKQRAVLDRFYSRDFLSPILGSLLFTEPIRWLLPQAVRPLRSDTVFERELESAWREDSGSDAFSRPFEEALALSHDKTVAPVVAYNATIAESGEDLVFSNAKIVDNGAGVSTADVTSDIDQLLNKDYEKGKNLGSPWSVLTLVEAIHMSARFPGISPPASLYGDWLREPNFYGETPFHSWGRETPRGCTYKKPSDKRCSDAYEMRIGTVVDGGYFDNSGTSALRFFIRQIDELRTTAAAKKDKKLLDTLLERVSVHVLVIRNDPADKQSVLTKSDSKPEPGRHPVTGVPPALVAPVYTLLNVRGESAKRNRDQTRATLDQIGSAANVPSRCDPNAGYTALGNVALSTGQLFDSLAGCARLKDTYAELSYGQVALPQVGVGGLMERCKRIVDPPLGWALSHKAAFSIRCLAQNWPVITPDRLLANGGFWARTARSREASPGEVNERSGLWQY